VAQLTARTSTRLDVAAPSVRVRDVRLAWSARRGLFATMLKPTPDSNADAIGLGAFLAPGAASFRTDRGDHARREHHPGVQPR